MSTTTISLPRPFIFTKAWLASVLIAHNAVGFAALYGQYYRLGQWDGASGCCMHFGHRCEGAACYSAGGDVAQAGGAA
jgi:hypothetical protein